ncbi:MAG: hypothetical protein ACQESR_02475 [Planctomycetota bacterium]
MERCPRQAVLPLVGLAADKVIRDRYNALLDSVFDFLLSCAHFFDAVSPHDACSQTPIAGQLGSVGSGARTGSARVGYLLEMVSCYGARSARATQSQDPILYGCGRGERGCARRWCHAVTQENPSRLRNRTGTDDGGGDLGRGEPRQPRAGERRHPARELQEHSGRREHD